MSEENVSCRLLKGSKTWRCLRKQTNQTKNLWTAFRSRYPQAFTLEAFLKISRSHLNLYSHYSWMISIVKQVIFFTSGLGSNPDLIHHLGTMTMKQIVKIDCFLRSHSKRFIVSLTQNLEKGFPLFDDIKLMVSTSLSLLTLILYVWKEKLGITFFRFFSLPFFPSQAALTKLKIRF